jgi:hypothetical protein
MLADMKRLRPSVHLAQKRSRGQAVVEFAITIGVVVILFFGVWLFWGYFQRTSTYVDASQTLGEWVSRAHDGGNNVRFTSAMRDTIRGQINNSILGNADEAYLFIVAVDSSTGAVLLQCGTPAPSPIGSDPSPPSDTGWDSCVTRFDDYVISNPGGLPRGTRLLVDIWGLDKISMPLIPLDTWLAPAGHSVSFVIG